MRSQFRKLQRRVQARIDRTLVLIQESLRSAESIRASLDAVALEQRLLMSATPMAPASGTNAAPVNSVPIGATTLIDQAVVFSADNGNAISVSDADAGNAEIDVSLSVSSGSLTLADSTGVTVQAGTGFNDRSLVIRGSQADINASLDGLIFTPDEGFAGIVELTVLTDDLDSAGTGTAESDTDRVFIGVHGTLSSTSDVNVSSVTSQTQTTLNENRGSQNAVALLPDGRYVVVWHSNSNAEAEPGTNDVFARILNADGSESVAAFAVNETDNSNPAEQFGASVVVNPSDGSFVVVWTSDQSGTPDIRMRRFGADGSALTPDLPVHSATAGIQNNAAIASNHRGEFVIVWEDSVDGLVIQRFSQTGDAVGSSIVVETDVTSRDPSVALDAAGNITVAWGFDSTGGIQLRRWDSATGDFTGPAQSVTSTNASGAPAIAVTDSGHGVIVWHEDVGTGRSWDIYHQRIDADGNLVGSPEIANTIASNSGQLIPSVAIDAAGNYTVVWRGATPGDNSGVAYRRFRADGSPLDSAEIRINSNTLGIDDHPSVAVLNTENLVAVYVDNAVDVRVRAFGLASAADTIAPTVIAEAATVSALANESFNLDVLVSDEDTRFDDLLLSFTSSDSSIIDAASITQSVVGGIRSLAITPQAGQTGTVTLTVTATDGSQMSSTAVEVSVLPRTITVTTTADELDGGASDILSRIANPGGSGISLREAILATNLSIGFDRIEFDISAPLVNGAHTIELLSELPEITDSVFIDGTTDSDFDSAPVIVVNGQNAGLGANGITLGVGSDDSTLQGLVINQFDANGVVIRSDRATVVGNFIGTDVAATAMEGNNQTGILLDESNDSVIGGAAVGDGNTIAFQGESGVALAPGSSRNTIIGNRIFQNDGLGIDLNDDDSVTVTNETPELTSADVASGDLTVSGSLAGVGGGVYQVSFYANGSADPSGHGEAERFLGTRTIDTSVGTSFSEVFSRASIVVGESVTATATSATGATSEFSLNVTVTGTEDAPVIVQPERVRVAKNGAFTFRTDQANGIQIHDQGDNGQVSVRLSVDAGTLTLSQTSGLTFAVDGTSVEFQGRRTAVNEALDNLTYSAATDFSGQIVIDIQATDIDAAGGPLSANQSITVVVGTELATTEAHLVNSSTAGVQATNGESRGSTNSVAVLPDGAYVVVFTDDTADGNSTDGVYARIFNPDGTERVAQFAVPADAAAADVDQRYASVVADEQGRFVVVWSAESSGNPDQVFFRRFHADGSAIDTVNVEVGAVSSDDRTEPAIDVNSSGQIVLSWRSGGTTEGIFARLLDFDTPTGSVLAGAEIQIDSRSAAQNAVVSINDNGDWVAVWQDGGQIFRRSFDSSGAQTHARQLIVARRNDPLLGIPISSSFRPDVLLLNDGRFAVTYSDRELIDLDQELILFDSNGQPVPDGSTSPSQRSVDSGADGSLGTDGEGLLYWTYTRNDEIYVEKYDISGGTLPQAVARTLVAQSVNDNSASSIAVVSADNFVVAWTGDDTADSEGVFARAFGTEISRNLQLSTAGDAVVGSDQFTSGGLLEFGGTPTFDTGAGGATSGAFNELVDIQDLLEPNVGLNAVHVVSRDLAFGGDEEQVRLRQGDILFVVDATTILDDTVFPTAFRLNPDTVYRLRPAIAGNIPAGGTIAPVDVLGDRITRINALTLVESDTRIGGVDVSAGTFLLTTTGLGDVDEIIAFDVATGDYRVLLHGPDLGISGIQGLELIEVDTMVGDASLSSGVLLISVAGNSTVGDNAESVTDNQIFELHLTRVSDPDNGVVAQGDAVVFFDGDDVLLGGGSEDVTAISLIGTQGTVAATPNASPEITGASAGLSVTDTDVISPFSTIVINDDDNDLVDVVVTLSDGDSNGHFTTASLGASGFSSTAVAGEYRLIGVSVVDAETAIRQLVFQPTENQVAVGATVTTTLTIAVTDGVSPIVTDSATTIEALSVNDAPELGDGVLTSIVEDALDPLGDTVANIFAGQFTDADSDTFVGIVVVGNTSSAGEGIWQYSSNGTDWLDIGSVNDGGDGLVLADSTLIRFLPTSDFNGTPSGLVVRALDNNYVSNGGAFSSTGPTASRVMLDTSSPSAMAFFSQATATISTSVSAVNDVPEISSISDQLIDEDETTGPLSFTVSDRETDFDTLLVTATSDDLTLVPASGLTLVDLGAGNWTIEVTPAPNQNGGPVTISIDVNDGTTIATRTFRVSVSAVNDPLGGTVTVNGTPVVGATLTAVESLTDADGIGAVTFQWQRNDVDIAGANSSSYVLVTDDAGQNIRAVVRHTDVDGTVEDIASSAVTINSRPEISNSSVNDPAFIQGRLPVTVLPLIEVTDANHTDLVSATIEITSGYVNGEDFLRFTDTADITGSFDAANGRLTLTAAPSATIADFQTAIRAVTYENTSSTLTPGERQLTVQVNDGIEDSSFLLQDVQVLRRAAISQIRTAPVIDGAIDSVWNEAASNSLDRLNPTGASSVVDNDDLSAEWRAAWDDGNLYLLIDVRDSDIQTGVGDLFQDDSVEVFLDGNFSRSATFDASGDYHFIIRAADGAVTVGAESASIPASFVSATSMTAGVGYQVELAISWSDLGVASPDLGTDIGIDIQVNDDDNDGDGNTNRDARIAWQDTTGRTDREPFRFGVGTLVESPNTPVSGDLSISGIAEEESVLQISSTLADPDFSGTFNYRWLRNGSVIAGETDLTYVLSEADVGQTISVQAFYTDAFGDVVVDSNSIGPVNAINNSAPVIVAGQTFTVNDNASSGTVVGTVNATDSDVLPTRFQDWIITSGDPGSIFTIDRDTGQVTVASPDLLPASVGTHILTISVSDGDNVSMLETIQITIVDTNQAATGAVTISGLLQEASTLTVSSSLSDPDGINNLRYQWFRDGNAIVGETSATYVLTSSDVGHNIRVAVEYEDSFGTQAVFSNVVGPVTGLNVAPEISLVADQIIVEDTSSVPITFNVSDRNDAISALTVTATSDTPSIIANSDASLALTQGTGGNFTLVITPEARAFGGPVRITLTVSDGGLSTSTEFLVTVTGVNNHAPNVSAGQTFSIAEDSGAGATVGHLNATDADLDSLRNWTIVSGNEAGIFSIDETSGAIVVADASRLDFETTATHELSVTVSDGTFTSSQEKVEIRVSDVNEAPSGGLERQSFVVPADTTLVTGTVLLNGVTDPEGDFLSIVVISSPANGQLVIEPDGGFSYAVDSGFSGSDSFIYVVSDGSVATQQRSVEIRVVTPLLTPVGTVVPDSTEAVSTRESPRSGEPESESETASETTSDAGQPSSTDELANTPEATVRQEVAQVSQSDSDKEQGLVIALQAPTQNPEIADSLLEQIFVSHVVERPRVNANGYNDRSSFDRVVGNRTVGVTTSESQSARIARVTFQQVVELQHTARYIDTLEETIENDHSLVEYTTEGVTIVGTSLFVGWMFTVIQNGVVALGFLTQLPVWTFFDPLMVVEGVGSKDDEQDSLEQIVDQQARKSEQKNRHTHLDEPVVSL